MDCDNLIEFVLIFLEPELFCAGSISVKKCWRHMDTI